MSTAGFQYLESWRLYLERNPSSIILFLVLGVGTFAIASACYCKTKVRLAILLISITNTGQTIPSKHETSSEAETGYPPITALPNFNWETTEPLVFRPFKPKYHLTMGMLQSQ
jgi:hypothetical protein